MITALTLGGFALTKDQWLLQTFKNGSFPATVYTRSKRGGKNGSKLITPTFSSYQFVADFLIVGTSFSDLALQRDAFLGIIGLVHSAGSQTLIATRSDGTSRQIDIKAVEVTGDISTDDGLSSLIEVTLEAEYPFLQSSSPKSQDVLLSNGGGMSVPMAVPLDLSHGHSSLVTIMNNGNYAAYPIFTFVGTLTNPTITNVNTSEALSLTYALATSGDSIIVDSFLGTVVIKPSGNVGRQYASGTFWVIQPGQTITVQLSTSVGGQAGKCTISFRDTYLNI